MTDIPNQDLNKEEYRSSGGPPFFPLQSATYTAIFAGLHFFSGYNGKAWHFHFAVTDSTNPAVVKDSIYVLRVNVGRDGKQGSVDGTKMRRWLAAIEGQNAADSAFDANKARERLRALGEDAIAEGIVCQIVASQKTKRLEATASAPAQDKVYTDFYVRRLT